MSNYNINPVSRHTNNFFESLSNSTNPTYIQPTQSTGLVPNYISPTAYAPLTPLYPDSVTLPTFATPPVTLSYANPSIYQSVYKPF